MVGNLGTRMSGWYGKEYGKVDGDVTQTISSTLFVLGIYSQFHDALFPKIQLKDNN